MILQDIAHLTSIAHPDAWGLIFQSLPQPFVFRLSFSPQAGQESSALPPPLLSTHVALPVFSCSSCFKDAFFIVSRCFLDGFQVLSGCFHCDSKCLLISSKEMPYWYFFRVLFMLSLSLFNNHLQYVCRLHNLLRRKALSCKRTAVHTNVDLTRMGGDGSKD